MTPAQAKAMHRRQIRAHGERVSLRREGLDPAPTSPNLRARVTGFTPQELASGIDQGSRKVILLAEDLDAAIAAGSWPAPAAGAAAVMKDDTLIVRGAPLNVESVDDSTRRIAGVLIAYEIVALG